MPSLIGNKPNQVPSNGDLGTLAFQDADNAIVGNLNATGVATVQAGTAAAPAITTTGDTNTGIFFPAADTIAFTEGGAESMRIDSSGQVGIGTNAPAVKLDIRSAGGGAGSTLRIGSGANDIGTIQFFNTVGSTVNSTITGNLEGSNAGGDLRFSTKATAGSLTERMRIDSSGNVGIGATANASAILDAQSTTKGVRMPNMTTTQKNAIASPAAGLMVFDTTLAKLCVYSGSAWQTITSI